MIETANRSIQEAAQFEGRDNPVFNYFKETYLKLLSEQECSHDNNTRPRNGFGLARSWAVIYTLTGGHRFITRMFCSYISDTYKDRPLTVTPSMVDSLVGNYIDLKGDKDFNEIFERLNRDYPEERDLCLELAQANKPVPFDAVDKDRVRQLESVTSWSASTAPQPSYQWT